MICHTVANDQHVDHWSGRECRDDLGNGVVFELANGASQISTLTRFNGANGITPIGTLIADSHGDLFGTTMLGGKHGMGTSRCRDSAFFGRWQLLLSPDVPKFIKAPVSDTYFTCSVGNSLVFSE